MKFDISNIETGFSGINFQEIDMKNIIQYFKQLFHNCIAHPLVGILPCRATDALHDWSAKKAFPEDFIDGEFIPNGFVNDRPEKTVN